MKANQMQRNIKHFGLSALICITVLLSTGCMHSINRTLTQIEAEESYNKGDFKRSFRLTEAMAYQGEKKAEYTLGYMYYYGIGVPQNKPLGVAWMHESAQKGYPPALVALNVINHQTMPTLPSAAANTLSVIPPITTTEIDERAAPLAYSASYIAPIEDEIVESALPPQNEPIFETTPLLSFFDMTNQILISEKL